MNTLKNLILRQQSSVKILIALFFFCALQVNLVAQNSKSEQKPITGLVVDAKGEAIIGASVIVKGTSNGTVTDINGSFKMNVPGDGKIVVSYIGYQKQEISVNSKSSYKVVLTEDNKVLDDVVVVGYGQAKKKSFSGSAANVKSEDLVALKTLSPTQALQGRASGVNVTTSSGMPGAPTTIRIRGINSINLSNDPLWIIDGVPMYSGGGLEASSSTVSQDPMSMINPNDIESIDILKDAASTAIYGSRASNGVIMVTTKSGKKQESKGTINVDYSTGFSNLTRTAKDIGFANTQQWIAMADKAIQYSTNNPAALFQPSMVLDLAKVPFTPLTRDQALQTNSDWVDQVIRTGQYQDVNLNFTRGFEGGSVYSSFNYRNDQGVLKNNDVSRITGRVNTDFSIIKNLQIGTNLAFSYSNNNRVKTGYSGSIGGGGGSTGAFEAANRNALPWMPIYDSTNPTGYWSASSGNLAANNDRSFIQDYVNQYRIVGNTYAELKIAPVKGLSLRTEFGLDYINNSSVDWLNGIITEDGKSYALDQNVNNFVYNYNFYAKYNNTIGVHSFSSVLGTESTSMNAWTRLMEAKGLTGQFPELGANAATILQMSSKFSDESYLRSYFFRTDYRLMDKYVLAVSLRTDGSSKFANDQRWGTFGAISGAWLLSEESFFGNFRNTMNQLKLKASFGQMGNNAIPSSRFNNTWTNSASTRYGLLGDIPAGTTMTGIGNQEITWETTNSVDYGIDYGFLNNRISGSLEGYYKKNQKMLLQAALPVSTGVGGNSIWENVGDMANYGVDFSISSKNIDTKDFSWSTDFNISTNQNKVLSLTPESNVGGKGVGYSSGTRAITGQSLGTFFMADYAGIDLDKGVEMIWEINQDTYNKTGETVKTGRKIPATYENVSLNRYLFKDKTVIPTYYGGLNNTFKSHGFDLNIFFTFSGGNYIYDYNMQRASYVNNGQTVLLADVNESTVWSPGKTDAKYPLQSWQSSYPGANWLSTAIDPNDPTGNTKGWWDPSTTNTGNYKLEALSHSKFLYKGDFIRLKNISLGYTMPSKLTSKISLQIVRIYAQVSNLLTITSYPGYDPEGARWVDAVGIPNTRTLSIGLSAKF